MTKLKIAKLLKLLFVMALLILCLSGCSSSSSKNEPWKELNTTKKEYESVYNYYRSGHW